jgi:hypothetical protein
MANVLNSLFGGGKPAPDPVKAAGDSGKLFIFLKSGFHNGQLMAQYPAWSCAQEATWSPLRTRPLTTIFGFRAQRLLH